MTTIINKIAQLLSALELLIANHLVSAQLESNHNVCEAGIILFGY